MAVAVSDIDGYQEMRIAVQGPDGADTLYILTGTVRFTFSGGGGDWKRDTLSFVCGPVFAPEQFLQAIALGTPASFKSTGGSQAGWAVDSVTASHSSSGMAQIKADLAVYSSSSQILMRMAFQIVVLAKMGG